MSDLPKGYDPLTDTMSYHSREDLARHEAAMRAFIQPETFELGAIVLRPATLGTLAILEETRNEFLFPRGPVKEQPTPDGKTFRGPTVENELFAALAFGYVHAGNLQEVRRAATSPAFFREKVLEFGDQLQPDQLPMLVQEIKQRLHDIRALQFQVQPKPEDSERKGPTPPPN